jgi:ACS family hexuronate transporter-like MFS transporter
MSLATVNAKIGKYRWTICALLFIATTVNYLDRQVLSILKDRLEVEFNWTESDYANIVTVFQATYAVSMIFAGRFIDWMGTKMGFAWSLIVWSVGAILHAMAKGTGGFMFGRAVLAFGESGNFPAAIKATAEWFPKKERALATGIFNSGTNIGAILAAPTVNWLADNWGWQSAFIIIGAVGFLWLILWFWLYEQPSRQKRLGKAEFEYIHSDNDEPVIQQATVATAEPDSGKVSWFNVLTYRQTWAFAFGKFMTDGIWWFFLFWLPAYLKAQYGMTGQSISLPLAVLYSMTCVGSIGGGAFPMYFINKGYTPYDGRMRAMIFIAMFPLVVLLAQPLGHISFWVPVILIGIGASAHQAWSANIFTTVSDMFPKKAVASVIGIGGMFGGFGGIIVNKCGGWLFDAYRTAGIANSWAQAKAGSLGSYVDQIFAQKLLNSHGAMVDLNMTALSSLPKDVVTQLQGINPDAFVALKQLQAPLVQAQMTTAYSIMFAICACSYLAAWAVMKVLVPRHKPITDL